MSAPHPRSGNGAGYLERSTSHSCWTTAFTSWSRCARGCVVFLVPVALAVIVIAVSVFPDVPLLPVIAAVASLIPSYLSYRWVENPLRYRSIDTRAGWGRLIAVSTGVPILVSMSVLVLNAQSFWSPAVASARASTDPHVDSVRGCAIDVPLDEIPWDECTWNTEASGVPIYLFGDSNAGQFSDTVLVAKEAGGP